MFTVEVEQEIDGRWIAEVVGLAGVLSYGADRREAIAHALALALRVLADPLEHGESLSDLDQVVMVQDPLIEPDEQNGGRKQQPPACR